MHEVCIHGGNITPKTTARLLMATLATYPVEEQWPQEGRFLVCPSELQHAHSVEPCGHQQCKERSMRLFAAKRSIDKAEQSDGVRSFLVSADLWKASWQERPRPADVASKAQAVVTYGPQTIWAASCRPIWTITTIFAQSGAHAFRRPSPESLKVCA